LLILGSCVAFDENTPFPSLYALAPTVGTALLIIFATPETLVGRVLASPPLVGIGLISYGAYLWHQPLFAFARYGSVDRLGAPALVTIAVLAFGLAYLMWRFVERPFRNRAIVSTKVLLLSSTTAIVFFVAFGLVALKSNGFDRLRISELQRKVLLTAARSPKLQECHTGGIDYLKPASACEYFFSPPEWAVLGNSHGVELAYALAVALKPRGVGVKQLTFSGCAPAYGREDHIQGCSSWTEEAVKDIESSPGLQNVVLSYKLVDLVDRDSGSAAPDEQELAEWNSYAGMIGEFVKAGKKVFVIVQAPELPKDVDFFIRGMTENDVEFLGGVDEARWNRSIAFMRDRLRTLPDTVTVIDPADYFCNGTMCAAVKDGEALYFDSNHMSLPGVRAIVDEILRRTEPQSPRSATASPH
jgi:hypothetical protein